MGNGARNIVVIAVIAAAGFTVACFAGAIVIYLIFHDPSPHFDPGTPGYVLQQYLSATETRDFETAYGLPSTTAQSQMPKKNYVICGRRSITRRRTSRITKYHATVDEREATIQVEVVDWEPDSVFGYPTDASVRMVRESETRRIEDLLVGVDSVKDLSICSDLVTK